MTSPVSTNDSTSAVNSGATLTQATGGTPPASGAGGAGSSTSFRNLADLKEKAPEVYNMMLQSLGMQMCREQNEAYARIKKMNREFQQSA